MGRQWLSEQTNGKVRDTDEIATRQGRSQRSVHMMLSLAFLVDAARKGDKAPRQKVQRLWWRLHDLRRTAKTLMVRAGVRPDISERVLGHVIRGVEGVYDRYEYIDEKREALAKLAAIVQTIVAPQPGGAVVRQNLS
jgi:integrase